MNTVLLRSFYNFMGAVNIGNGFWMLFFAENWYFNLPAGIEDTGPLNTHFVHDIGLVYCIVGIGAFYCSTRINNCRAVHIGVLLFIVGHALIHVVEISIGLLPPSHWMIDFPLLFVPALLILAITPSVLKIQTEKL